MKDNALGFCYRISIALLSASILLLLFFIVVTGAKDWFFTMLGWIALVFAISSSVLFFIQRRQKALG